MHGTGLQRVGCDNAICREAKGDPGNPVTASELSTKARTLLLEGGAGHERSEALIASILGLIDDKPVRSLALIEALSGTLALAPSTRSI